jgi:hypothetical protein
MQFGEQAVVHIDTTAEFEDLVTVLPKMFPPSSGLDRYLSNIQG